MKDSSHEHDGRYVEVVDCEVDSCNISNIYLHQEQLTSYTSTYNCDSCNIMDKLHLTHNEQLPSSYLLRLKPHYMDKWTFCAPYIITVA